LNTFLKELAGHIVEKSLSGQPYDWVVLPNKRAVVFLLKEIKLKARGAMMLPSMVSIPDFAAQLSGYSIISPSDMGLPFYETYRKVLGKEALGFPEYYGMIGTLFGDFNEIDLHMENPKGFFTELDEVKAMELWSPDRNGLTEFQKNYLNFWKVVPLLHQALHDYFRKNQSGFSGFVFRRTLETIRNGWEESVLFAGFNALSGVEEEIIHELLKQPHNGIWFHADDYYTENKSHEAGLFLRRLKDKWAGFKNCCLFNENVLAKEEMDCKVLGVSGNYANGLIAGNELHKLLSQTNDESIAIVITDDSQILPVLEQLPADVAVNVTGGIPFSSCNGTEFFRLLLELTYQLTGNADKLSTRTLIQFYSHPFNRLYLGERYSSVILDLLKKSGSVYYSASTIINEIPGFKPARHLDWLAKTMNSGVDAFLEALLDYIQHLLSKRLGDNAIHARFIKAQCGIIKDVTEAFLIDWNKFVFLKECRFDVLAELILSGAASQKIPLQGNAQGRVQLMAFLETRLLNFNHVIICGVNEGLLPVSSSPLTFIPFDLRRSYQLPTKKQQESVYAYHFYRLLQGCRSTVMIYNTIQDSLGSGEKSRYILQLEHELSKINPLFHFSEEIITLPIPEYSEREIIIEKTPEIIKVIKEKLTEGFYPSSINLYKNCSLKYYFEKVLKLKEPEEVESELSAAEMGNIIHNLLEQLYKPFKSKKLDKKVLLESLNKLDEMLDQTLAGSLSGMDFSTGRNLLLKEVCRKIVEMFVNNECRSDSDIEIKSLEQNISYTASVKDFSFSISGKADRIDVCDKRLRIIDYKTGYLKAAPGVYSPSQNELVLENLEDLFLPLEKDKAFQILIYLLIWKKNHPDTAHFTAGIMPLKKHIGHFFEIYTELSLDEVLDLVENKIHEYVGELINPEIPFKQTENRDVCEYCGFRSTCSR
jgi:ATP-dependent helicase/nuclease subunit B